MRRLERPEETVLYRPYGEPHWDLIGNRGARCFLVEFDETSISSLAGVKPPLSRPDVRRGNLSRLAVRAYREWVRKDDAHTLVIQALAHEMIADIIRSDGNCVRLNAPIWLRRCKEALDDCYAEALTLTELARLGGVHPMHLARAFRQHYQTSVGEYLRQRRIEAASDQLVHTDKSLTEIAIESGFSSHGHFCTAFKRVTSLTPSEFRRLRR
jgi:AraC family transcriptional regulator